MKLNRKRIVILVGIVVLLFGLIWQFRGGGRGISWLETYAYDSRDPYGANVLYQLLDHYFPGYSVKLLEDSLQLPGDGVGGANYVFIGNGMVLDSLEVERLLDFVARGNRALLISRTLPDGLMQRLLPSVSCDGEFWYWEDYYELEDTAVRLSLPAHGRSPGLSHNIYYRRRSTVSPYRWQYFDRVFFCGDDDSTMSALGYMNDTLVNFGALPHGKGLFLFHSTPMAFSNLHLLEKSMLPYAEEVFSKLAVGPIYWDEYSKVPEEVARRRNQAGYPPAERRLNTQSPLQYVLSQPALTWAWYLLLGLALLYLLFRSKRRQRAIPVREPNANTSLEFLETIGRLYFLQNDHRGLVLQQMKLFLAFVRRRYGLQTHDSEVDFVEKLAGKSEIPADHIRDLLARHRAIERSARIEAEELIAFHQKIEHFYKYCK